MTFVPPLPHHGQAVRSRRVLQVITASHMSGAEMQVVRITRQMAARGHIFSAAIQRNSPAIPEMQRRGLDVCPLSIGGKLNLAAIPVLARHAKKLGAELLHSSNSTASWWCGWLDRLGGPPSVGHVHGFTSAHLWHSNQSHLLAVSGAVKEDLISRGLPAERITVLHNALDPEEFLPTRDPLAVRSELGADAETPVIGTFGHLSEKKGHRDLFQAIPTILGECPTAQFWIVGQGPLREELELTARRHGFLSNVRLLGYRRDAADLMNAIDVMALPSHREPCALVYVEAALLAKPIVACRSGGAPESVADRETGILVPVRDSRAIAAAILTLLTNCEVSRRMGQDGHARALDIFSWKTFIQTLEGVYERVLDERSSQAKPGRRVA
jgi:glycosyltransferase involved in cell wall biosynthesis